MMQQGKMTIQFAPTASEPNSECKCTTSALTGQFLLAPR